MSKPYTLNELLIITIAKEIRDYENVVLGVGLPMISGALAKALFTPNATLIMESGIIDFKPIVPIENIADCMSFRGFSCATDLFSAFTMTYRGFVDVCFLGVAQVDRFGNLNTTVIGDYDNPDIRLPGSGGAADFLSYAKRTILTMRGGEFVENLAYRTSPGYLDGGDSRDKTGHFAPGSGPTKLISTQGIFEFDPVTKEMFLSGLHPGVTVEAVRKKVPWDLKVSKDLRQTERPKDEEIDYIRRNFPTESISKGLVREITLANFARRLEQNGNSK
ncbi:MAG TPA: CoA-transferase [Thermodesulfobacteriota bacterium]|nr:CoA-transferase [Thermodesulfobacteriota bacterium]